MKDKVYLYGKIEPVYSSMLKCAKCGALLWCMPHVCKPLNGIQRAKEVVEKSNNNEHL
jgi:hypothetical protein